MVDLVGALYFLAGAFLAYAFYDSNRQRKAILESMSEPLLKKHLFWHSLLVLAIVIFYEIPIAGFLFGVGPAEYAVTRRFVFAFFVVAAYFTIKPLFELSRVYSFRRNKPAKTEALVSSVLMLFFIIVIASVALYPTVLAQWFIPSLALLLPVSGAIYYYAGKRISAAFSEENLRRYVSVHGFLVLLVFLLTELEVSLQAGLVPPALVNWVGFIGIVALAGAVELEKNIALKHVHAFAQEYSFDGIKGIKLVGAGRKR